MIECQQVKQMLPLWIGQDLPDVSSAADVARHLEGCQKCEQQRKSLQSSMEFLQGSSSETLPVESHRRSVWPQLALQISEWDDRQNRDRFNGRLPASVMALAVTLMLAVSIPSIIQEFFGDDGNTASVDRFNSDPVLDSFRTSGQPKQIQPPQAFHVTGKIKLEKRSSAYQW